MHYNYLRSNFYFLTLIRLFQLFTCILSNINKRIWMNEWMLLPVALRFLCLCVLCSWRTCAYRWMVEWRPSCVIWLRVAFVVCQKCVVTWVILSWRNCLRASRHLTGWMDASGRAVAVFLMPCIRLLQPTGCDFDNWAKFMLCLLWVLLERCMRNRSLCDAVNNTVSVCRLLTCLVLPVDTAGRLLRMRTMLSRWSTPGAKPAWQTAWKSTWGTYYEHVYSSENWQKI